MIEVVVAEEVQVDLCQNIDAGILSIAIAEDKDGGIDDQKADDDRDSVLVIAKQGEERYDAVAESDALHDSPDAQMTEAQEITLNGVVEPVDEETYHEEKYRTLDDATDDLRRGFELRLHQRKVARDSHDKEEEGEDEVAGRHAVPLGMLERFKGFTPAVIDENHPRHRNAAEDI